MSDFDAVAEVDMMLGEEPRVRTFNPAPPRAFDAVREVDHMLGAPASTLALTGRETGVGSPRPAQSPAPPVSFDAAREVDAMLGGSTADAPRGSRALSGPTTVQELRRVPTLADQWQGGVETVTQGAAGGRMAAAFRNLQLFDRIDQGYTPVDPNEDPEVYYQRGPRQRAQVRRRIEEEFGRDLVWLLESQARQRALPRVPEVQALEDALKNYDFGRAWQVFRSNPGGIMQQVTVESLPASIGPAFAGIALGPLGRIPAMIGTVAGSYAAEFGPRLVEKLFESLQERRVDTQNADAIRQAIAADPEIVRTAVDRAGLGAFGPAIFDAITLGFTRGIRQGAGVLRNSGRAGGNVARETGGEMLGEAAGQQFQGDEFDLGKMALEGIGGVGQTGPTTVASTLIEARDNARQIPGQLVPEPFDAAAEVDQMLGARAGGQHVDAIVPSPEPVADALQSQAPVAPEQSPSESAPVVEASPAPENARRAQIASNASVEYAMTPEAEAHATQIHSIFESTVGRKLPSDARVAYVERIFDQDGNAQLGAYVDATRTLYVALRATDATGAWRSAAEIRGTISHEVIEALHARGLFRENEWAALMRNADAWIKHYDIAARYPGASHAQMRVEATAERLGGWLGGQRGGITGPALAAFRRVAEVLRALAGWAHGQGFHTPESILRRIESGEVARREAHPPDPGGSGSSAIAQTAPKGAVSVSGDRTRLQRADAGEELLARPQGVLASIDAVASAEHLSEHASRGEARFQTPRSGGARADKLRGQAKRTRRVDTLDPAAPPSNRPPIGAQSGTRITPAARVAQNYRKGLAAEAVAGVSANKERFYLERDGKWIKGATKASRYRVPDVIDHVRKIIREVKDTAYLHFSRQLKDDIAIARHLGWKFELQMRPGTRLSKPLRDAIARGDIIPVDLDAPNSLARPPPP